MIPALKTWQAAITVVDSGTNVLLDATEWFIVLQHYVKLWDLKRCYILETITMRSKSGITDVSLLLVSHFSLPSTHSFSVWYSHLASGLDCLTGLPSALVVWWQFLASTQCPLRHDFCLCQVCCFFGSHVISQFWEDFWLAANNLHTTQRI